MSRVASRWPFISYNGQWTNYLRVPREVVTFRDHVFDPYRGPFWTRAVPIAAAKAKVIQSNSGVGVGGTSTTSPVPQTADVSKVNDTIVEANAIVNRPDAPGDTWMQLRQEYIASQANVALKAQVCQQWNDEFEPTVRALAWGPAYAMTHYLWQFHRLHSSKFSQESVDTHLGALAPALRSLVKIEVVDGAARGALCVSCLDRLDKKLHRFDHSARIAYVRYADEAYATGVLPMEAVEEIAATLYPSYAIRGTRRADALCKRAQVNIDGLMRDSTARCWNWLYYIAMVSPKYQIQCVISNADYWGLDQHERHFLKQIYASSALRCDFRERARIATFIVDCWTKGLPVWGLVPGQPGLREQLIDWCKGRLRTGSSSGNMPRWAFIKNSNPVLYFIMMESAKSGIALLQGDHGKILLPWYNKYFSMSDGPNDSLSLKVLLHRDWLRPTNIAERGRLDSALSCLNMVYPPSCEVDFLKMSTQPRNITANLLDVRPHWHANNGYASEKDQHDAWYHHWLQVLEWCPPGTPAPMYIHTLLLTLENPHIKPVLLYSAKRGIFHLPIEARSAALKDVSVGLRAYGKLPNLHAVPVRSIPACLGLEAGRGRYTMHSNVARELQKRGTVTRHWSTKSVLAEYGDMRDAEDQGYLERDPLFYELLSKHMRRNIANAIDGRAINRPLVEALENRYEWLASGSAPGSTVHTPYGAARGNKRTVSERYHAEEIALRLRATIPAEHGVGSEKHENDKSRLLLSVPEAHYMITSYVTAGMERRLHCIPNIEKGLSGMAQIAVEVKKVEESASDRHLACLDYSDFNIQHTAEALDCTLEGIEFATRAIPRHEDWQWGLNWCRASLKNRSFDFSGCAGADGTSYVCHQGMYSGTRMTDLWNTSLNLCYFDVAVELAKERFNTVLLNPYRVHQGDDMYLACDSVAPALAVWLTLRLMGLSMQPTKQMLGRRHGEFLRVQYVDGKCCGILSRSLINYILKPLQQVAQLDPAVSIPTLQSTICVLQRRGMAQSTTNLVYYDGLELLRKVRIRCDDLSAPVIPLCVVFGNRNDGGMGMPPPGYKPVRSGLVISLPADDNIIPSDFTSSLPTGMTDDWIRYLSRRTGGMTIDSDALRQTAMEANYAGIYRALHVKTITRNRQHEWAQFIKKIMPRITLHDYAIFAKLECADVNNMIEDSMQDVVRHSSQSDLKIGDIRSWFPVICSWLEGRICENLRRRVGGCDEGLPTGINSALHAALAATTFKSMATTLVALGGNREAAVSFVAESVAQLGHSSEDVIHVLSRPAKGVLATSVILSAKERVLGLECLCGKINPAVLVECSDLGMDLLWPQLARSDLQSEKAISAMHKLYGLLILYFWCSHPDAKIKN